MALREADDPTLYARVQEQNLLRQYDLLTNCIEIGLIKGIDAFDKYTLWSLNANRAPYYVALKDADQHWDNGQLNVDALAEYLADLLKAQLSEP